MSKTLPQPVSQASGRPVGIVCYSRAIGSRLRTRSITLRPCDLSSSTGCWILNLQGREKILLATRVRSRSWESKSRRGKRPYLRLLISSRSRKKIGRARESILIRPFGVRSGGNSFKVLGWALHIIDVVLSIRKTFAC